MGSFITSIEKKELHIAEPLHNIRQSRSYERWRQIC